MQRGSDQNCAFASGRKPSPKRRRGREGGKLDPAAEAFGRATSPGEGEGASRFGMGKAPAGEAERYSGGHDRRAGPSSSQKPESLSPSQKELTYLAEPSAPERARSTASEADAPCSEIASRPTWAQSRGQRLWTAAAFSLEARMASAGQLLASVGEVSRTCLCPGAPRLSVAFSPGEGLGIREIDHGRRRSALCDEIVLARGVLDAIAQARSLGIQGTGRIEEGRDVAEKANALAAKARDSSRQVGIERAVP